VKTFVKIKRLHPSKAAQESRGGKWTTTTAEQAKTKSVQRCAMR
jgi:hypothetical protein